MKHVLLTTTMALALSVAGGAAFAQTQQPSAGTGMQSGCKAGDPSCQSGGSTEGQSSGTMTPKSEGQTGEATMPKKKNQANEATQPKTEGQAGETTQPKTQGQAGNTTQPKTEGQAGNTTMPKTQGQANETTQPKTQGQAQAPSTTNETTGAIGNVNVTAEQKTEIKQIITETKVEPARVDFDVAVGVTVPRTVKVHRLPARIVKLVPAYKDYEYFVLADGRIVIVDPDSLKIVVILT